MRFNCEVKPMVKSGLTVSMANKRHEMTDTKQVDG